MAMQAHTYTQSMMARIDEYVCVGSHATLTCMFKTGSLRGVDSAPRFSLLINVESSAVEYSKKLRAFLRGGRFCEKEKYIPHSEIAMSENSLDVDADSPEFSFALIDRALEFIGTHLASIPVQTQSRQAKSRRGPICITCRTGDVCSLVVALAYLVELRNRTLDEAIAQCSGAGAHIALALGRLSPRILARLRDREARAHMHERITLHLLAILPNLSATSAPTGALAMSSTPDLNLEDMFVHVVAGTRVYSYPCTCGRKFCITETKLREASNAARDALAACSSCALHVRVKNTLPLNDGSTNNPSDDEATDIVHVAPTFNGWTLVPDSHSSQRLARNPFEFMLESHLLGSYAHVSAAVTTDAVSGAQTSLAPRPHYDTNALDISLTRHSARRSHTTSTCVSGADDVLRRDAAAWINTQLVEAIREDETCADERAWAWKWPRARYWIGHRYGYANVYSLVSPHLAANGSGSGSGSESESAASAARTPKRYINWTQINCAKRTVKYMRCGCRYGNSWELGTASNPYPEIHSIVWHQILHHSHEYRRANTVYRCHQRCRLTCSCDFTTASVLVRLVDGNVALVHQYGTIASPTIQTIFASSLDDVWTNHMRTIDDDGSAKARPLYNCANLKYGKVDFYVAIRALYTRETRELPLTRCLRELILDLVLDTAPPVATGTDAIRDELAPTYSSPEHAPERDAVRDPRLANANYVFTSPLPREMLGFYRARR